MTEVGSVANDKNNLENIDQEFCQQKDNNECLSDGIDKTEEEDVKTLDNDTVKKEDKNIDNSNNTADNNEEKPIESGDEGDGLDEILQHEKEEKYKGRTCQLPDFAVIYSFLEMFGPILELPAVSISDLEQAIDCTKEFSKLKCMPL